ncbi:MAG TPA: sigma 54-interacting transcriptional regulator, partial [Candidatus Acidoferrales bacterium]|nr:sigma 54-interacting transcriptional regulator [Candidatus Acidoferrales bacterium]
LPLEMQAKLLRVLQEKEVRPVGGNEQVQVDVRVIAATNRDLEAAYRSGLFRKDLYFRLNVVTVHMPALRERRSDIPVLAHTFLDRYAPGENIHISAEAKALLEYDWPGNIRELENSIARAVVLGDRRTVQLTDLPPSVRDAVGTASQEEASAAPGRRPGSTDLEDIEYQTILRVFKEAGGDKALTGKMLGISRATLYRKLKRYGIGFKPDEGDEAAEPPEPPVA